MSAPADLSHLAALEGIELESLGALPQAAAPAPAEERPPPEAPKAEAEPAGTHGAIFVRAKPRVVEGKPAARSAQLTRRNRVL